MARRKAKAKRRRRKAAPDSRPHRFGTFNVIARRVTSWMLPVNADENVTWGPDSDMGRRQRRR